MRSIQDRLGQVPRGGWIRAALWGTLYVAFVVWVAWGDWASLGWLVLLPLIIDMFTTKFINYGWWRKYKDTKPLLFTICSWIDAIVFALVAVYFINLFIFQNYQIPSSSLEKSLRVGDFLFVSKMSYGARVPNTPLSMPLVQHTFPAWLGGGKSYIEHPQWAYKRLKGWDKPKKGDIVVFNFPNGDTVMRKDPAADYHQAVRDMGSREAVERLYGPLIVRPVDKTDHYVKRCVALPGDSLEVRDGLVWINGTKQEVYDGVQIIGEMHTAEHPGVRCLQGSYTYEAMRGNARLGMDQGNHSGDFVSDATALFPYYSADCSWTRDFYGPVWIPKKGTSVVLTAENLPLYKRLIEVYEGGKATPGTTYTFQQDYYFMMGDNRHNSLDSRYWGFVPEDHIVGKPFMIWLSTDPEKGSFPFNIRWNRFFKFL